MVKEFIKTVMYEPREYSYIGLMAESPAIEKNKIEPLQATSLYASLFASISALVSLATSNASLISTDFYFAVFSTSISGTLSTKGMPESLDLESSVSSVSSRSLSVALF